MAHFEPTTVEDLARIVTWAAAERQTLEVFGNATKRCMGRPVTALHTLSTAKLSGICLYEPEELVLSAKAGTPLSQIEALLEANNQYLAFEPKHQGEQTIGGVVATNLSGPRRVHVGAVRDHLLGFTGVNGHGETFKSGGRVVKNVTGYASIQADDRVVWHAGGTFGGDIEGLAAARGAGDAGGTRASVARWRSASVSCVGNAV